jgi:hypothetical protein
MQAVPLVHDTLESQENDGVAEALAGAAIPVASASTASAGTTAPAAALLLLIR